MNIDNVSKSETALEMFLVLMVFGPPMAYIMLKWVV